MSKQKCGDCRYMYQREGGNRDADHSFNTELGECRRFPPQYLGTADDGSFSYVNSLASADWRGPSVHVKLRWCGEFKPKAQ